MPTLSANLRSMAQVSYPEHHKDESRTWFENPWRPVKTWKEAGYALLQLPFARPGPIPEHVKPTKTVTPDWSIYSEEESLRSICATWLGHAGFVVQLPLPSHAPQGSRPVRVVFDPMFSSRASPSTWFGPWRYLPPPCTIQQLLDIDYVVISHNHYDHMDMIAIRALYDKSPTTHFLVPLGLKPLLTAATIPSSQITELDWWQTAEFPAAYITPHSAGLTSTTSSMESLAPASISGPTTHKTVFVCTPAQHNSGRSAFDQNSTLWASWVVRQVPTTSTDNIQQGVSSHPTASVYFAGDTGYQTGSGPCPAFKEIGTKYGPFDLSIIPIWRGATLSFIGRLGWRLADDTHLATLHASPEDALCLHHDVRSRHSLACHFATFAGSADEVIEPLVRLVTARMKEREKQGKRYADDEDRGDWWEEGGFGAIDNGESVRVPLSA